MLFFLDYWYLVLVVPAMIISLIASLNVKSTFKKYNNISVRSGMDSKEVVNRILSQNNIHDVSVGVVAGELTDHYNPAKKVLNLSQSTADRSTVGAIGVAAHEAGPAIQYAEGYFPVKLRTTMVPIVNIGSYLGFYLAIFGLIFNSAMGDIFIQIGVALYSLAFIFTLVTLPVEFNASKRAVAVLDGMGTFTQEEIGGVKKVLRAAALTYVASMIAALANLLRLVLIIASSRNRDS